MTPEEQKIVERAREILRSYINRNPVISSWTQLLDYAHATIAGLPREVFHVLYLDRQNRLIEDVRVSEGTVAHVPVYPREVARMALELDASAVILIHNHPSGDPTPSKEDIQMTGRVQDALRSLDITVHDHLIIGADREHSMRAAGEMYA